MSIPRNIDERTRSGGKRRRSAGGAFPRFGQTQQPVRSGAHPDRPDPVSRAETLPAWLNVAPVDGALRVLAAVFLLALFQTGRVSGSATVPLVCLAAALFLTGVLGWCPLYSVLGVRTAAAGHRRRWPGRRAGPGTGS